MSLELQGQAFGCPLYLQSFLLTPADPAIRYGNITIPQVKGRLNHYLSPE